MRNVLLKRWRFPRYWEEIIEHPGSPAAAIARMKELFAAYRPESREGITFWLEDDRGDALHVGLSRAGWVIMHDPQAGPGRIALGDGSREGHQTFLIPEWTEFERIYLIPRKVAEAVLRFWLETGDLSSDVTWVT
jgi:hypothetical protein